jgi:DNA polymerase V
MPITVQAHDDVTARSWCRAVSVARATTSPRAVPMALEAVHAGFPSVAQDYFSGDFSFDEHIIEHPDTTFIVTVAGDSMQGAGIWDGDLLVVDRSLTPEPGDVVVAVLDGELTVKRLLFQGSRPILHPENPRYPDFRPMDDEDLTIWGVVTGNFHPQSRSGPRTVDTPTLRQHTNGRGTAAPTPGIIRPGQRQGASSAATSPSRAGSDGATPGAQHRRTGHPPYGGDGRYPHDGWAC